MKRQKGILLIVLLVVIAAFASVGIWYCQRPFKFTVGGQEVSQETYLHIMNTQIADVTAYFAQKGADRVNDNFWTKEVDGEIPYEVLADRTVERLKYLAAAYDTAEENEVLDADGLTHIWERMEEENTNRKEQAEEGKPVYGLLEFSMDTFLEYDLDRLQKAYCQNTDHPEMDITEEERQTYYEENKDRIFRKNDDISIEYLKIECHDMKEEEKEAWKEKLTTVYKKTDKTNTLSEAAEDMPEVEGRIEKLELSSAEVSAYTRTSGDILDYAEELKTGECTPVMEENGFFYLIQCTARTEYDYQPLDEVKDNINKQLREEKYEKMLREKAENENISQEQNEIYSFTRKNI